MENLYESSSDSDSNLSSSWAFVCDNKREIEKSEDVYNCLKEHIQDVTEQDSLSTNSDHESDTDGISVISESEFIPDLPNFNAVQTYVVDEITKNDDCETFSGLYLPPQCFKVDKKNVFKQCNVVGICVITAAIILGYNQILNKFVTNYDSEVPKDHLLFEKSMLNNVSSNMNYKIYNDLNQNLETIVDITLSCTYGNKPNNIQNNEIKKCVKKLYKTQIQNSILINDLEALVAEINLDEGKQNVDLNKDINNHKNINKKTAIKKEPMKIYNVEDENSKLKHKDKKKINLINSAKSETKIKDFKKQSSFYKKKFKSKAYKNLNNYQHFKNKHPSTKNVDGNYIKYKRMCKTSNTNPSTKFNTNDKIYKIKKHKNSKQHSKQQNDSEFDEWYTKLHKARRDIRKREHLSDWIFDRALNRKKKRDKAQ